MLKGSFELLTPQPNVGTANATGEVAAHRGSINFTK